LEELIAAHEDRERTASRLVNLANAVGSTRPGDVRYSKVEVAVREARKALAIGEAPPVLGRDPGLPRGGSIPADESPWPPARA
jgi:hypothetical protein